MEKVLSAYTFSAAGEVFPFFLNSITQYKQYTVNSIPDIRILEGGVHKRRGQVEEEGAGISRMRPAH